MAVSRLSKQSIQAGFPKQQTIWDQSTSVAGMDPIGGITLSSTQSSVVFSNIPQTYTHLQLRVFAHETGTYSGGSFVGMQFNTDTSYSSTNYSGHALYGDGSTTYAAGGGGGKWVYMNRVANDSFNSNIFGCLIVDILDYTNTNKYKTVRWLGGFDANGSGRIDLDSSVWLNTSAINTMTFVYDTGAFAANSNFALYGIK